MGRLLKPVKVKCIARLRGAVFSFGQVACAPRGPERRAGFFFKLVLALVARGWFFLLVKWLCAPRGPEAELVFSLSWFPRWWRGGCFLFRSNSFALRAGQRQGGVFRIPPPYLWTPRSPQRVKGCSPLTIPKMRSKPKNASRFAKRIFLCFSHLRLRRRFHLSAGLYALRGRNTRCEAANRRNEKKALSEAASFFPFRQLLRDYQGRAALDSCLPRLESSGHFSGSLLVRKRELSPA